jgi:hypothetical protein
MRLLRQAMAVLGSVVVIAVIVALVTPKTAHAIVATAVQVVNPLSQPVPMLATDALTSFVTVEQCEFGSDAFQPNSCFLPNIYTVPQGKVAVLESLTAACSVNAGTAPWRLEMQENSPDGIVEQDFPPSPPVATNFSFPESVTALNLKSYASTGAISMAVRATASEIGFGCNVTLSGHLVSTQ